MLAEQVQSLRPRHLLPDEGLIGRDDALHLLLDGVQVVGRERPSDVEVVVEAVGDGGSDGEGGALEEFEDRLGHYVGGRVTEDMAALLRLRGDYREPSPGMDRLLQVHQDAVDRDRDGRSGQARADRSGHPESGHSGLVADQGLVGENQFNSHSRVRAGGGAIVIR